MGKETWDAVDDYVAELLIGPDLVLEQALEASAAAGLPEIAVTASQGKLLNLLARVHGASSILEVGTLGGYSTIWLARALPDDGRLVTLELREDFARVATENVARAGLTERVEVRVGPAIDSLRTLIESNEGPFDLIFIDADKQSTPAYFELALKLSRPGGVILIDNVVLDGTLIDAESEDPRVAGMRGFLEFAAAEPRITATTIQTVGNKGYDGFTLVLVEDV